MLLFYKACLSQATVYLSRIDALLSRQSLALSQQTLYLPCFLPMSVHRSSLSETKKVTGASRVLHLLGNSPASIPRFQVGAGSPHEDSLAELKHPGAASWGLKGHFYFWVGPFLCWMRKLREPFRLPSAQESWRNTHRVRVSGAGRPAEGHTVLPC